MPTNEAEDNRDPWRTYVEALMVAAMRYGWELARAGTENAPDPIFDWVDGVPVLIADSSHLTEGD